MKSLCLMFLLSLIMATGFGQSVNDISIIPQPVSLEKKNGQFELNASTAIV